MTKTNNCLVCHRINLIKSGENPFFVKELKTGYIVLCDYQYFYGYTIFLSKTHTDELFKLKPKEKRLFLEEMSLVSEAVFRAFHPKKLNYELLGNSDSHLHWHLIPRYSTDPKPQNPIWAIDSKIRNNQKYQPSQEELGSIKQKLLLELDKLYLSDKLNP